MRPRTWYRLTGAFLGALLFAGFTLALEMPYYPPEKKTAVHLIAQATFPMMVGALLGVWIGHRIARKTWRRLVAPGCGAFLGSTVIFALTVPDTPEKIGFAWVMACTLVGGIPGAIVGAVGGWLYRRMSR